MEGVHSYDGGFISWHCPQIKSPEWPSLISKTFTDKGMKWDGGVIVRKLWKVDPRMKKMSEEPNIHLRCQQTPASYFYFGEVRTVIKDP